jgi:ribosomal protein S21
MEIHRRHHETVGAMLRRFSRRVQQSGIILRARKLRYREKDLSVRAQKERALRRIAMRKEATRLEKLGKTDEE